MTRIPSARTLLALCFIYILISIPAQAQLENLLMSPGFVTITSDCGNSPVDTFEDVDAIKNIRIETPDAWDAMFVSWPLLMNMLSNHFDHATLGKLQTMLATPKVLLGGADGAADVDQFYRKYGFLVRGPCPGCDKEGHNHSGGKWHYNNGPIGWGAGASVLDEPPHDAPDSIEYIAGLEGGWKYVLPPTWPGPHFTCDCHKRGCPGSVCEEHEVPDPKPDDPGHMKTDVDHKRASANVCYDNGPVKSSLETDHTGNKKEPEGTVTFKITWKDRTPPQITGATGNEIGHFPYLGRKPGPPSTARRATTGDFFKPSDLTAKDNDEGILTSRFAIGRINGPVDATSAWNPVETWDWIGSEAKSLSGMHLGKHVFLPNDCLGEMKYSVFVWDKNNVLNPGCPNIVEDSPETTYGMNMGDLGRDPKTAKPFPYMYDENSPPDPAARFADGEGKIWIDDNDLPNLMIRLASKRDEGKPQSAVVLPPPITTLTTFDPGYTAFIDNACKTYDELAATENGEGAFVKIVKIDLGNCPTAEQGWDWKFHAGPMPPGLTDPFPVKFWYQNFRLEDYSASDNDTDAEPIDNDEASFGKRNGFGSSATVFCMIPVVEDVQYDLSLWAEDNVKWLNDEDDLLHLPVTRIPAPYTGIARARLSYGIENVYPPVTGNVDLPPNAFSTQPLPVIFREPTPPLPPGGGATLGALQSGKYPWVEATATDYAGLTRTLRVYFTVTDEKTSIRTLEQKHQRN
ncbi:MAG TPA: hypothetical protein PLP29_01785 [Candidatus Ozemobacteraceae bacterium]|nr:hypothetical protein [Candidatus Ozemobacteraceae bacterium]